MGCRTLGVGLTGSSLVPVMTKASAELTIVGCSSKTG